jgi:hypothetical protein
MRYTVSSFYVAILTLLVERRLPQRDGIGAVTVENTSDLLLKCEQNGRTDTYIDSEPTGLCPFSHRNSPPIYQGRQVVFD